MKDLKAKPLSTLIVAPVLILIFIRPFLSGLAYPKAEAFYELLMIFLAALALIIEIKNRFRVLPKTFEYFPVLSILLAYALSTVFSINKINSLFETVKFISLASVFFIASLLDDRQKKALMKTVIIAGAIIGIYAIYQYFWGYDNTLAYLKETNSDFLKSSSYGKEILIDKRAMATFPSPTILGGYLAMMFFLGLQLKGAQKILYLILITAALLLTKSLGAWLALMATLIIWTILSYKDIKHKKPILAISVITLAIIIAFILITRWERLTNLNNQHNSITQRLNYWRTAMAVIKEHPFLGIGPGNFQEVFLKYKVGLSANTRYAHNIFLHTWAETGLLGFIALTYLVIAFLTKAKSKSRYIFWAGLVFLIHNLIDNTYFIPETGLFWWVLLAILITCNSLHNTDKQPE